MDKNNTYVSFVVIGRNDDYGHRFLYRIQRFIDNLVYLCEKCELPSELIFVEWNPPKDKERLYEALKIKKDREFLKIRFVEVPKEIHDKVKTSDKMPLLEFLGKNAGMRRAKGEFIVFTNPDIIFSEDMIRFFSQKKLKKKIFYRANRYDLSVDIPTDMKAEDVEKFCEKNWDFCWSAYFGRYHRAMKIIPDLPRLFARLLTKMTKNKAYLRYHGGSPGDFMLLAREEVMNLRGYPEMNVHGGMDGYVSIMAVASGNKLKILKEKTYHQSHGPAGERPMPNMENYIADAKRMLSEKKAMVFNSDDWGLKKFSLKETEL
ncbi:hypothetical protein HY212_05570 [Candidatus Pacearchaeota archaeon]|nr:hypothetical protein [Candidatus Pacearchaeota archaeon]